MEAISMTRRVDWPLVLGPSVRAPEPHAPRGGVVNVLSAIDELSCYADRDVLLRRAVELLRDRIGLERVGLFLFDQQDRLMHGTFGTGLNGQTTDERNIAFAMGHNHNEAFRRARADGDRWLLLDHAPRTVQIEGETRVLESGWIVLIPMLSDGGPLGLLASDGALTQAPMVEALHTQAAVFLSLLARLLEHQTQQPSARSSPFRIRHPRAIARTELVSRAVELIRRQPGLGRRELARRLATTESRLGKLFKAEMGFTVTNYRNRLRLETFLRLVSDGDANLTQASLEAGFGSYAQFHRVFRTTLGATPREYLTGNSETTGDRTE